MKINKRTADALKKRNLAEIGRLFTPNISKQGVADWVKHKRIPDKRVNAVQEFTGLSIK